VARLEPGAGAKELREPWFKILPSGGAPNPPSLKSRDPYRHWSVSSLWKKFISPVFFHKFPPLALLVFRKGYSGPVIYSGRIPEEPIQILQDRILCIFLHLIVVFRSILNINYSDLTSGMASRGLSFLFCTLACRVCNFIAHTRLYIIYIIIIK
jgi:hypothetical protein